MANLPDEYVGPEELARRICLKCGGAIYPEVRAAGYEGVAGYALCYCRELAEEEKCKEVRMAHIIPDNYIERREARLDDLMRFGDFAAETLFGVCETARGSAGLIEAIRSSLKLAYESGYIHAVRDHQPRREPLCTDEPINNEYEK